MPRRKIRKSLWLPATLALYSGVMDWYFGPKLIAEGQSLKFWISVGVEAVFIVALFFVLRRKEKLAGYWNRPRE